jgi:predicted outer membrane repeat protein
MYNHDSSPLVLGCTFIDNVGTADGAGMFNDDHSSAMVINSKFLGNSASDGSSEDANPCDGGGMVNSAGSNSMVLGCLFVGNSAENRGGAMWNRNAYPTIINCTFSQNSAGGQGGAVYVDKISSQLLVSNSILWGDSPTEVYPAGEFDVRNSDISGGHAGDGNIDLNPMFANPGGGDFSLSAGSPCIDAGTNEDVPLDDLDLDVDGRACERLPQDLVGDPRIQDDASIADSGVGLPAVVDMGALEYSGELHVCIADIAPPGGDGYVTIADITLTISQFGTCAQCCGNINGDTTVTIADITLVLTAFGPCP